MTLPAALSGILNFLRGVRFGEGVDRIMGYEAPLSGNPNDLALLLNLMLPFAIGLLLGTRSLRPRLLLGGIIAVMVTTIVVSFSRGGFITLAVVAVAYVAKLQRRRERGLAWTGVLLALAALPLIPAGYADRLSTIFSVESDPTGSAQARWLVTQTAVAYLATHPVVGAGLGQDITLLDLSGISGTRIHNMYLEYGVDLGWPGLALFVALLMRALGNARRAARRWEAEDRQLFFLAQGLHVSLIAFAVAALFHPGGYFFPFFYLVGLSVALAALGRARPTPVAP
jgi:O-antigen ligase